VDDIANQTAKDALTFLKAVYQHPKVPLSVRMRAAQAALPFEVPKLGITAVISNQEDFAAMLDRRLARAREIGILPRPKAIEHHPSELNPNGFRRRF
jgi:hypothetical protein